MEQGSFYGIFKRETQALAYALNLSFLLGQYFAVSGRVSVSLFSDIHANFIGRGAVLSSQVVLTVE